MGTETKIQWVDHTASPWHGCSEVSPGCNACYAREGAKRNPDVLGVWGPNGTRVKSKSFIGNLRRWNKLGEATQRVQSVFPSICDPFEDRPELVPWREEMFAEIDQLPWVRLLLLTKRPENILRMWAPTYRWYQTSPQHWQYESPVGSKRFRAVVCQNDGWASFSMPGGYTAVHSDGRYEEHEAGERKTIEECRLEVERRIPTTRANVWLGVTVEDQAHTKRLDELRKCRDLAPVLFVSAEPLLEAVDFRPWLADVDQIIVGGESGPNARPFNLDWAWSIVQQCRAAKVACFVKQIGDQGYVERTEVAGYKTATPIRAPIKAGHHGEDFELFPKHLQIREMPVPRFDPAPPAPATLGKLF